MILTQNARSKRSEEGTNFGFPEFDKYLKVLTFYYYIIIMFCLTKKPQNMRNTLKYQAGDWMIWHYIAVTR